jgi:serine/threonine-protein kinase HipA
MVGNAGRGVRIPPPRTIRDLAMECGDQGRFANAGNILSQDARFLLEREEAGNIIAETKDQVAKTWEETVRASGASQSDVDAIRSAFVYKGFSSYR